MGSNGGKKFFSLFVDRIQEGLATLIPERPAEGELVVPRAALPAGIKEGDYLAVCLELDEARARDVRRDIDSLMSELGDNP